MLVWKVLDVKKCMNAMLASEAFDFLLLSDAQITTKIHYEIDGHLTPGYLTEEERRMESIPEKGCIPYGHLRGVCFDVIKGKRKPASFRFTFLCPRSGIRQIIAQGQLAVRPEDVANLTLNVKYANEELYITAGCTLHTFTMDRAMENAWDAWVAGFLKRLEIAVETV